MTPETFVNEYNFHDSLIDSVTIENDGSVIRMVIDFAFWMQEDYKEEHAETGPLAVSFSDVMEYDCPDQLSLEEISILKTSLQDDCIIFALLNDITDEYHEIRIKAKEVTVIDQTGQE